MQRGRPGEQRVVYPAFSYDRISDDVQASGVSLDFQNAHAGTYAKENSLDIHTTFAVVESASKEGRKVFNEMLDLAERLGIRDLIFKNTDRMSRNYQDLVRIEKLIEKGFNIHFYQSNLVINKDSNYNDRFLIGIQLAVAKHTSDKISQDIREHNKFKASQGIAPGPSPFGYKYDSKLKSHVIDSESETLCRNFFDEFDRGGYSLRDYADHLNAEGIQTPKGKQWRSSGLHYTLTNPFYHGEFWYQDRLWPGKHAPYYAKARYEERVKRLGDGFRGLKKRTFQFRLAGLVRCSCGRLMSGEIKKGRYGDFFRPIELCLMVQESDDDCPLAFLRETIIKRIQNFPACLIPENFQPFQNAAYCAFPVMCGELLDILKNEQRRFFHLEDTVNFKEEGSSDVIKPHAISNDTERLTRKPGTQHFVIGDFISTDLGNISRRLYAKVMRVNL